jgi:hypothetical protein
MRRIIAFVAAVALVLAVAAPADARWGCGWGGGWGYRSCGYGGYGGWGGYRSCGYGWGGWGGGWCGGYSIGYCRPYISVGYCGPSYCSPGYGYGYGGYYPMPVSTYTYALNGLYYNPAANFVASPAPAYQPVALPTLSTLRVTTTTPASKAMPTAIARSTSAEAYLRASKYLDQGDALFRAQNFHSALQKYKLAANAAPELAEAYWRQGHALIATSNFDLAASAFKRAVAIDPDARRPGFTLDKLYGTAGMAKTAHIEALADWSLANADSATPYFLMGVTLHYDGQADRAGRFFARAGEMSGVTGGYLAVFEPGAIEPSVTTIEAPTLTGVAAPLVAVEL